MPPSALEKLWSESIQIPNNSTGSFKLASFRLAIGRQSGEYQFLVQRKPDDATGEGYSAGGGFPGDAEPLRFVCGDDRGLLEIRPVMPDRSVVVRPEQPIRILPGNDALFFVSIPVWLRVQLPSSEPLSLSEFPIVILSKTWFGDTTGGELCYALKSSARRALADLQFKPWRAVCPITVRNRGNAQLDLQRLCIQTKHLGCFLGQQHLWTHTVDVVHRGLETDIAVTYPETPPTYETGLRLLTEPRQPTHQSFLHRGFGSFRIPGFL